MGMIDMLTVLGRLFNPRLLLFFSSCYWNENIICASLFIVSKYLISVFSNDVKLTLQVDRVQAEILLRFYSTSIPPKYGQSPFGYRTCRCSNRSFNRVYISPGYSHSRKTRSSLSTLSRRETDKYSKDTEKSKRSRPSGINPRMLQYRVVEYVKDLHRYCPRVY